VEKEVILPGQGIRIKDNRYKLFEIMYKELSHKLFIKVILAFMVLVSIWNIVTNGFIQSIASQGVDFIVYYNFSLNPDPRVAHTDHPWFLYFPSWSIFFRPFLLFSFPVAKNIWVLINGLIITGFICCTGCLVPSEGKSSKWFWMTIGCLLALNFPPLWVTVQNGQINLLVLGLVTASFLARQKGWIRTAGICLGLAITTRYTPAFLLLYWFISKEYRVIFWSLLTVGVQVILSLMVLGWQVHIDYFLLGQHYSRYVLSHPNYFGNVSFYSLMCNLREWGYLPRKFPVLPVHYLWALFAATMTGTVAYLSQKNKTSPQQNTFGLFMVALPLLSFFGETHQYTITLPGLLYLAYISIKRQHPLAIVASVVSLVGTIIAYYVPFIIQTNWFTHPEIFSYFDGMGMVITWGIYCYLIYTQADLEKQPKPEGSLG